MLVHKVNLAWIFRRQCRFTNSGILHIPQLHLMQFTDEVQDPIGSWRLGSSFSSWKPLSSTRPSLQHPHPHGCGLYVLKLYLTRVILIFNYLKFNNSTDFPGFLCLAYFKSMFSSSLQFCFLLKHHGIFQH